MEHSIKTLCRIPGAKVKFSPDNIKQYTSNPWFTFGKVNEDEVKNNLSKFYTVIKCSPLCVYIDMSEHFPISSRITTHFSYERFSQVKCYISAHAQEEG